jgi:hypothetical protein
VPGDVAARARVILRLPEEQALDESFIVERRESGLHVELRRADGVVIGERLLPEAGSCDELTQAAAVTLSAWLSDVHPDFAAELPSAPPTVVLEPPGSAQPAPTPAAPPSAAPPVTPPPPLTMPAAPSVLPAQPVSSSPRTATPRLRWELDGGVGAGIADGEWVLDGSLAAGFVSTQGWGARLGVLVDASRRAPLGLGSVSWRRWPLWGGPSWRFGFGALALDVSSGPALTWLRVAGADLSQPRARNALTWAWTVDARLASRGRWGWFVGVSGYAYLGESSAFVGGSEYSLPRFALSTLVGGRFAP